MKRVFGSFYEEICDFDRMTMQEKFKIVVWSAGHSPMVPYDAKMLSGQTQKSDLKKIHCYSG